MDKRRTKDILCNGYIFTLVECDRKKYLGFKSFKDDPCFMNLEGWVLKSVIKALQRNSKPKTHKK